MSNPLIRFTNLLHKTQDPDAPEIRQFKEDHPDETFLRRANVIELAFRALLSEQSKEDSGKQSTDRGRAAGTA